MEIKAKHLKIVNTINHTAKNKNHKYLNVDFSFGSFDFSQWAYFMQLWPFLRWAGKGLHILNWKNLEG